MKNLKWYIAIAFLIIVVATMAFFRYLDYSNLHNEWIVVYPGDESAFVEYRVSLFDLRILVSESELTLEQAVRRKLVEQLEHHPRSPRDCTILELLGNLQGGVLVQARCDTYVRD